MKKREERLVTIATFCSSDKYANAAMKELRSKYDNNSEVVLKTINPETNEKYQSRDTL